MAREKSVEPSTAEAKKLTCGLIMPISSIDSCSADHWLEVKSIIASAIEGIDDYDFEVKIVSDQDDVGVIQKRIVQNVYNSDIVVCDVSCKNPNVMFELGMRLAFDKPTIIIKDDKTDYSFDTGVIEHLTYPRDLRFNRIVAFKSSLANKVSATYKAFVDDPNHSTFLKSFGTFRVASLDQKELSESQLIVEMLSEMSSKISAVQRSMPGRTSSRHLSMGKNGKILRIESNDKAIHDALTRYAYETGFSQTSIIEKLGQEEFYKTIEKFLAPHVRFDSIADLAMQVDSYVIENLL